MKRYWQFLLVGIICLLVALLWAQPPRSPVTTPEAVTLALSAPVQSNSSAPAAKPPTATADKGNNGKGSSDDPLPGSSSSLPLLAVIGFGVLAGGITSAMRTR
jgi:hypothetical protein